MAGAREEILRRVRASLEDVPAGERPADVPVARAYRRTTADGADALLERFAERLRDYRAEVRRVRAASIGEVVSDACARRKLGQIVVPSPLPGSWRPHSVEVVEDDGLSAGQLDRLDGALTGCAVAIAETGTIALDGQGASGRRAITLVPDHHICVVEARQVVGSVPEAMAALADAVIHHRAPVTFISGPSASSDIELTRVEGVHGPRNLLVLLVDEDVDRDRPRSLRAGDRQGDDRNRTGVDGFAGRCVATPPRRRGLVG